MADKLKIKMKLRAARKARIRQRIKGDAKCPRFNVYRSLQHIYAQLIDDQSGKTLVCASDLELKAKKGKKLDKAKEVGKLIAQKAVAKKISRVVFDRGGFKFHGRVKAVADGAREGGLKF
ncbi:MAG: 50S ribosomal protein L18 [Candidatus Parcubacteria bacterium]|nr:50S ribosomal protein L18 [Candidatus Parcubacteria bacterium]